MNEEHGVLRVDAGLDASALENKYNPEGYGEHPVFRRSDWRFAVANERKA